MKTTEQGRQKEIENTYIFGHFMSAVGYIGVMVGAAVELVNVPHFLKYVEAGGNMSFPLGTLAGVGVLSLSGYALHWANDALHRGNLQYAMSQDALIDQRR